jgi:hypothetical protein
VLEGLSGALDQEYEVEVWVMENNLGLSDYKNVRVPDRDGPCEYENNNHQLFQQNR